jgi:hypothetical protein
MQKRGLVLVSATTICVQHVFALHGHHTGPTPPEAEPGQYGWHYWPPSFRLSPLLPLNGDNNYTLQFLKLPKFDYMSAIPENGTYKECVEGLIHCSTLYSLSLRNNTETSAPGVFIYVRHQSPGKDKESNWLQSPEGPFYINVQLPRWNFSIATGYGPQQLSP